MGSFQNPRVFHPVDLQIVELVYKAVWALVEARDPFREREYDEERAAAIRRLVMDQCDEGRMKFDTLYARVVANIPEPWLKFTGPAN